MNKGSQVWQHVPIVPATWEGKAVGSLEPRSLKPTQAIQREWLKKKKRKKAKDLSRYFSKEDIHGQQVDEKKFKITDHQRNANQNHFEILPQNC